MFLQTVHPFELIKKQYVFKLRAFVDSISSLVGIQLLAILFSLGGIGSSGSFSGGMSISVKYFSADLVIAFTMMWGFTTAITMTTKPQRYQDFTFVTNRLTSNLANVFFLLTVSVIGATTALLSKKLILFIATIFMDMEFFAPPFMVDGFFIGILATILYILLASALGYFIGVLVQMSRLFVFAIPALFIGSLFLDAASNRNPLMMDILEFYFLESSVLLFLVKVIFSIAILFLSSIFILNRMEVKK